MSERERAKRIIIEIIRQAGGTLENKTNLFKAFYAAHRSFAESQPGYLSHYPIVRMPNGPGIHAATSLLEELVASGFLEIDTIPKGNFEAFCFRVTDTAPTGDLTDAEIEAIQSGVKFVDGLTAGDASERSHEVSRSWNQAEDGDELNIYIDSLTDSEYARSCERMAVSREALKAAWGD